MTTSFLTILMVSSLAVFSFLTLMISDLMNEERGFNTWCVLLSQAIGAMIAYAVSN